MSAVSTWRTLLLSDCYVLARKLVRIAFLAINTKHVDAATCKLIVNVPTTEHHVHIYSDIFYRIRLTGDCLKPIEPTQSCFLLRPSCSTDHTWLYEMAVQPPYGNSEVTTILRGALQPHAMTQ
eukprot:910950-Pleurochrysis_carterae.AAC.12